MTSASFNLIKSVNSFAEAVRNSTTKSLSSDRVTITASTASGVGISFSLPSNKDATPLPQDVFYATTLYGSSTVPASSASDLHYERLQRVDAYADRVMEALKKVEVGGEGERNIKFQQVRQFLEPGGYFSGGLLAAGFDPHEKITVTFNTYVGRGSPTHLTSSSNRTYLAWEIAAGALAHDKVQRGGPINFHSMHIEPNDRNKVNELESVGIDLQSHWEKEIAKPMRNPSGALARRSGQADVYVVLGTLQSLVNGKDGLSSLSAEGQLSIRRTLENNGQIIIPNLYGYPIAGYAFVPYQEYDGNPENRPSRGLMIDLNNGTVSEIQDAKDAADWAKNNRNSVLRGFNASDRQGGKDAHWPRAADVLDNFIAGNHSSYPGYQNPVKDKAVPVWETFNYTESRGGAYQLKYGKLNSDMAGKYQEANANNAVWSDQTQVFGSSQQSWKTAEEVWSNTFGYAPVVGSTGNIVFGIHDGIYGMTAADRVGGNAAVVISGLQLAHELAPGVAERGLADVPVPSISQYYRWSATARANNLELVSVPRVSQGSTAVRAFTEMREIQVGGKKYFAALAPDAGDGVHFQLRVRDPKDPSKLANSGVVAKPDDAGVWTRRGVVGGGRDLGIVPLDYTQASHALESVIAEQKKASGPPSPSERKKYNDAMQGLVTTSNAEDLEAIADYADKDTHSINEDLRSGEDTEELRQFLEEFEQLNNYTGKAYRTAFITPEGADAIRNGVGRVFQDKGVQSASITVRNSIEWESWAEEQVEELDNATQRVVYVFDESLPKKNMSLGSWSDHVALAPEEPMQVMAVKDAGNKLFVYFSKPSRASAVTYNVFSGNVVESGASAQTKSAGSVRTSFASDILLGGAEHKSPVRLKERIAGSTLQRPADPEQILELNKSPEGRYTFRPLSPNAKPVIAEGAYAFVIRADEPDKVYMGSMNKGLTPEGKAYPYNRYINPEWVDGHSALTQGLRAMKGGSTDVVYAGTVYIKNGVPEFWTNASGHYLPPAELQSTNLTSKAKNILPADKFFDEDKLTPAQKKTWDSSVYMSREEQAINNEFVKSEYGVGSSGSDSDSDLSDSDND